MKKRFLKAMSILLATAILIGTTLPLGLTSVMAETDPSIIMNWGDFSQYANDFTIEGASEESGNPGIALESAMGKKWLAIKNVTNDWKSRGINESFTGDKTLTGTVDFSFTFKYAEATDSCMRFFIFADAAKPTTANLALKITKGSIGLYRNPAGSAFNADKELIGNTLPFTTNNSPYRVRVIIDDSYISVSVTPLSTTDGATATAETQSFTEAKDPAINSFTGGIYAITYHIGFRMTDACVSLPSSTQKYSSYYKDWGNFTDTPDNYFTNGGADGIIVDKVTDNNASWLRIYGAGNTQTIIPQSFSEAKVLNDNFNWDFTFRAGPYPYHYANFYMLDEYGTGENCYFIRISNGASKEADAEKNVNNIQLYRRKAGEEDVVLGETYCAGITDSKPYRFNISVTKENINIKIANCSDTTETYTVNGTRDPEDNFAGGLYFGRYNGTVRLTDMQVYTNYVYFGKNWGDFSATPNDYFTTGGVSNVIIDKNTLDGKNWLRIYNGSNTTMKIPQSFSEDNILSESFEWIFTFRAGPYDWFKTTFYMLDKDGKGENCYYLQITNGASKANDVANERKNIRLYRRKAGEQDIVLGETYCEGITDSKPYRFNISVTKEDINIKITNSSNTTDTYTINGTRDPEDNFAGGLYFSKYNGTVRLTDMLISSENALVSHNHTYNTTELSSDYHSHFHCCECGAIKDIETHTLAYKCTGIENCSVCGYDAVVNVDIGDCNGDDYVDIRDLVTIKKHEILTSTKINLHNADCNEDGEYNGSTDLVALRQILLGVKKK